MNARVIEVLSGAFQVLTLMTEGDHSGKISGLLPAGNQESSGIQATGLTLLFDFTGLQWVSVFLEMDGRLNDAFNR